MRSPFPGMDPFLEHPAHFPDLHDSLITYLREALNGALPAPYFAGIGSRVWVEVTERFVGPDVKILHTGEPSLASNSGGGAVVAEAVEVKPLIIQLPEDEIREPFLEIYFGPDKNRLVTSVEVLSLSNKTRGEHGRELYQAKQQEVLDSKVNLVEIDLHRAGEHTTAVPLKWMRAQSGPFDYHACVRRFDMRGKFTVYPILLPQKLPTIAIPLLPDDAAVRVDLQAVLDRCYVAGRYERRLDYEAPVVPPLSPELAAWAKQVVAKAKV